MSKTVLQNNRQPGNNPLPFRRSFVVFLAFFLHGSPKTPQNHLSGTYLLSQKSKKVVYAPTHGTTFFASAAPCLPSHKFGLQCVLGRWAFLGKGSSKASDKCFCEKSESFLQKNRQNVQCQVFHGYLIFIAFWGVCQRWEFKSQQQKLCKKSFQKVFKKKSTKIPIRFVFGDFVYQVFENIQRKF
jgi:hypothetical protein